MAVISNPTMQMLTEAQNAYHALLTGRSARVVVDQNGERVEFTAARKADLAAYIQQLQVALGLAGPAVGQIPGPVGFVF